MNGTSYVVCTTFGLAMNPQAIMLGSPWSLLLQPPQQAQKVQQPEKLSPMITTVSIEAHAKTARGFRPPRIKTLAEANFEIERRKIV